MSETYSLEEGGFLVSLARSAVTSYLRERVVPKAPVATPSRLKDPRGAFVTIRTHPSLDLRGCIGRPYPTQPLVEAVIESAVDAAVDDPRFNPMTADELPSVTFEVSVLTEPTLVQVKSPVEYRQKVVIGRDGVIFKWYGGAGLLLPQVPVEEGWDIDTYLSYACVKAGTTPDMWLSKEALLYTFTAVVFEEVEPGGPTRKKSLEPR